MEPAKRAVPGIYSDILTQDDTIRLGYWQGYTHPGKGPRNKP